MAGDDRGTLARRRFVPVTVAAPAMPPGPALQLRLANGTVLEWQESPSPGMLALVLSQVRA